MSSTQIGPVSPTSKEFLLHEVVKPPCVGLPRLQLFLRRLSSRTFPLQKPYVLPSRKWVTNSKFLLIVSSLSVWTVEVLEVSSIVYSHGKTYHTGQRKRAYFVLSTQRVLDLLELQSEDQDLAVYFLRKLAFIIQRSINLLQIWTSSEWAQMSLHMVLLDTSDTEKRAMYLWYF